MIIKVNSLIEPFVDTEPKFSWSYPNDEFSSQKEYSISIASDADFKNIVFAKKDSTDERANIKTGKTFLPCKKYFVKVVSVTEDGKIYDGTTSFSTGMPKNKWEARFITGGKARKKDDVLAAVYLRRDFSAGKNLRRAVMYIAGLGFFEAHINGKKVGDDFMSEPYTAYDKNILYRAFDVTDMISEGENAVGVILGNGFYNCFTIDPWQTNTAPWRDVPKLLLELHLEYDDGTEKVLSDKSWKYVEGPITFNGIRHGEEYDARLEKDGWDMPGYAGESFNVRYVMDPGANLILSEMEPIRVRFKYHPVSVRKVKNGWLYEIEQNQAGVAHFTFRGKKDTTYRIRYCDRLYEDGELDQEALSCFIKNYTFQTDVYTKKSDLPEEWNAVFAYYGFKYFEVSGCEEPIDLSDIEVWSLCNDVGVRGEFTSSDEDLNKIQKMCLYSTTSCLVNTFASDAVREKSSWTGDTGLSAEQLMINFGAENVMKKWQMDLRDAQRPRGCVPCIVPSPGWGYNSLNGPDWSNPAVDVPVCLYREYGDTDIVKENYDSLCRHVSYIGDMANGYIPSYGLGDWCPPFDGPAISVNMSAYKCPIEVSDTAYYHGAVLAAKSFAEILGLKDDAEKYRVLAENIRKAFRENFYDPENHTVKGDCQTATGMMLYHGLAEKEEIPYILSTLIKQIEEKDGHLDFGVLGCKAVLDSLGKYGRADIGLSVLLNKTYPSMKRWIDDGNTTLIECWNGGGSRNHHMFSSVSAFFYKYIAGISAASPAYRDIDFRPAYFCGLESANAYIDTPYGRAESGFVSKDGKATVRVVVPSSCRGRLYIGDEVKELSAGVHTFETEK